MDDIQQYDRCEDKGEDAVVRQTDDDNTKSKTTDDEDQQAQVALGTFSNFIEKMADVKRMISEGLEARKDYAALLKSHAVLQKDHAELQKNYDKAVEDKRELLQNMSSYDSHIEAAQRLFDKGQKKTNKARQSLKRRLSSAQDDLQPQTSFFEQAETTTARKRPRLDDTSPPRPELAHGSSGVNRPSDQIQPAVRQPSILLGKPIDVRVPATSLAMTVQAQLTGSRTRTTIASTGGEKATSTSGLQQTIPIPWTPWIPHGWYDDNDGMFRIDKYQVSSPELVARAQKAWSHWESLSGTELFMLRNIRSVPLTPARKATFMSWPQETISIPWLWEGWFEDNAGMFHVRGPRWALSLEVVNRVNKAWYSWESLSGTELFVLKNILRRGQTS